MDVHMLCVCVFISFVVVSEAAHLLKGCTTEGKKGKPRCCEGWKYNSTLHECEPHCLRKCINAKCTARDTCTCNEGFKYAENDQFTCIPLCPDGYKLLNDSCLPECEKCTNGHCISPNVCSCNPGYFENNGSCIPQCKDCNNGTCVAPDKCNCSFGFIESDGKCKPACGTCVNGHCNEEGKCTCFDGFTGEDCTEIRPTCSSCEGKCDNNLSCFCPDGTQCQHDYPEISVTHQDLTGERLNCSSCEGKCENNFNCFCPDGTKCQYDFTEILDAPQDMTYERQESGVAWKWCLGVGALFLCIVTIAVYSVKYRRKLRIHRDNGDILSTSVIAPSGPNSLFSDKIRSITEDHLEGVCEDGLLQRERDNASSIPT